MEGTFLCLISCYNDFFNYVAFLEDKPMIFLSSFDVFYYWNFSIGVFLFLCSFDLFRLENILAPTLSYSYLHRIKLSEAGYQTCNLLVGKPKP